MVLVLVDGRKSIPEVNKAGFMWLCNSVSEMTGG